MGARLGPMQGVAAVAPEVKVEPAAAELPAKGAAVVATAAAVAAVAVATATAAASPLESAAAAPVAARPHAASQQLPQIRRLRVCLLGGDTFVHGVGKTDVAAALLRGLTADQPGASDPAFDLAFDRGVFERAWRDLLAAEPPTAVGDSSAGASNGSDGTGAGGGSAGGASGTGSSSASGSCDRWGAGPIAAWDGEGRIRFDRRTRGESTPPYDADPAEECASLCAGHAEKMHLGHKRSSGHFRAFREVLGAAGQDLDGFEAVHRELYTAAEASPRELVRRDHPCSGMQAAFARFSPEVGGFHGCGAVILHIFEPGFWPRGSPQNVAMLYTAAPNTRLHSGLNGGALLIALRAAGSNIARAVREYNRHAAAQATPEGWERAMWLQADLRAQVEYCLSDRNLKTDRPFRERIALEEDGWLDLDLLKAGYREEELFGALSESKCVETKVAEDGKVFVRRAGGRPVPDVPGMPVPRGTKRKNHEDPTCWDFVAKGSCPRGDKCRYIHAMPGVAPEPPDAVQEPGNGSSPVQAAAAAAVLAGANLGVVAEAAPSPGGVATPLPELTAGTLPSLIPELADVLSKAPDIQKVVPLSQPQPAQQQQQPQSAAPGDKPVQALAAVKAVEGNGVSDGQLLVKIEQPASEERPPKKTKVDGAPCVDVAAEAERAA